LFTALNVISVVLALLLGVFGLNLVFSDKIFPDESTFDSMSGRVFLGVAFFFIIGLIIGFINPKGWWISGFAAWGGIFMGGLLTIVAIRKYGLGAFTAEEPPYIHSGLALLILPIGLALSGGYLGKYLRMNRQKKLIDSNEIP